MTKELEYSIKYKDYKLGNWIEKNRATYWNNMSYSDKILFYLIVLTWLFSIFFMIYHVLPSLLTAYYAYDDSSIIFFLNLYLDGLMVSMFVFIFIRDKHKALSILIALFYVLANFMIEDSPNTVLFYLFPQFSSYFSQITLAYPYKICYICLGLTINLIQINYETL